jgi:hypothetical protein
MANDTQTRDYSRGYAAGYRAGAGIGAAKPWPPYSSNMQAILRVICEAGLLWVIDAQGHKCELVRPQGTIHTSPQGDKYGLALWGEGTGAALAGIGDELALALGVAWARVDLDGDGRAWVTLPHESRTHQGPNTRGRPSSVRPSPLGRLLYK